MKVSLKHDKNNTTSTSETPTMQSNPADKGIFSIKMITKTLAQTQTTPSQKQELQRSPVHPPTSKTNNLEKNQTSNPEPKRAENSPQSERDNTPRRERIKLSNLPSKPTET